MVLMRFLFPKYQDTKNSEKCVYVDRHPIHADNQVRSSAVIKHFQFSEAMLMNDVAVGNEQGWSSL